MAKPLSPLIPESVYAKRRREVLKRINGGVALFTANPVATLSRDRDYPFHQHTDFFYLTGFNEPEAALVLRSDGHGPSSVLFLRDSDPQRERWEGPRLGLKKARKAFQVDEVRPFVELPRKFRELVLGHPTLYYSPAGIRAIDELVFASLRSPVESREPLPFSVTDARAILNDMRVVKDHHEIELMRRAAAITGQSLIDISPMLPEFETELDVARSLESLFTQYGADGFAFDTIVASGPNATSLHHRPGTRKLRRSEAILIDSGATYGHYCADITRVLPLNGAFSPAQAVVYEIVHTALTNVTKRIRPGITLDELQRKAVKELSTGLVDAKIVKGPASAVILAGTYKKYYMHGIGHWLGLDSHDPSPFVSQKNGSFLAGRLRPLEAGNVITIEPGLYFDPKETSVAKEFRGIGIRLEDDVLVTSRGYDVLTGRVPSSREDIEAITGY
ncbi:MAG: aminopeptidase P N-terminal domain-containing protein [Deltaproteobacteria bacterium]|nr:aminopeptidase P N-terminal domain-containing protein [Deltaproteobacteria bacterium]